MFYALLQDFMKYFFMNVNKIAVCVNNDNGKWCRIALFKGVSENMFFKFLGAIYFQHQLK